MFGIVTEWRFTKHIKGLVLSFNGHAYGLLRIGGVNFPIWNEYTPGQLTYFKGSLCLCPSGKKANTKSG